MGASPSHAAPADQPTTEHPGDDATALPAADSAHSESATRPCVYCGRPVPQRGSAGRPFRYCRDNDNACQRHARNGRMRERNSPGLPGQVARSWELVERLELAAATLADALHAELSPAGVERQAATVRAEAATQIAGAHTERDEARREAEAARATAATLGDELKAAEAETLRLAADLTAVRAEAAMVRATVAEAVRERDEARASAAAEAALRADAYTQRDAAGVLADQRHAQAAQAGRDRLAAVADRDDALAVAAAATHDRDAAAASAEAARVAAAAAGADRDVARAGVARIADEYAAVKAAAESGAARQRDLEAAAETLRDERLRAVWDRDAARQEVAVAGAAADALRAEYADLATRVAALGGDLAGARAELAAERSLHARLDAQIGTLTAALTQPAAPAT